MALTKEIVVDKIEVLEMGQLQVRTVTRVKEDGSVLSQSFHRHVVEPDADTSNEDQRVKDVANTVHTPAVKQAWADLQASQEI